MVHEHSGTCMRWQQEGAQNQRMGVNQCTATLFLPRTRGHAVHCTRNSSAHSIAPKKLNQPNHGHQHPIAMVIHTQ